VERRPQRKEAEEMAQLKTERSLERSRALALGFLLLVTLLIAGSLIERPARAEAFPILFVVNNTADSGNGICNASECTLREAIDAANDTPGKDAIHFDIPGGGVKTIKPTFQLPQITDEVTIDGYTQPGASENTLKKGTNAVLKIELNGKNAGTAPGLVIEANNSVVRGLVINRFDQNGVELGGSHNNKVRGNFLGTDSGGTLDRGNSRGGVSCGGTSGDNTIGGNTPGARNLISGNDRGGVLIENSTHNGIKGNLIGTGKDGTTALGNSDGGVRIFANSIQNVVGGNTAAAANIIAFNHGDGVAVDDDDPYNTNNSILRASVNRAHGRREGRPSQR
jgi:CSLREA domain-containing protein